MRQPDPVQTRSPDRLTRFRNSNAPRNRGSGPQGSGPIHAGLCPLALRGRSSRQGGTILANPAFALQPYHLSSRRRLPQLARLQDITCPLSFRNGGHLVGIGGISAGRYYTATPAQGERVRALVPDARRQSPLRARRPRRFPRSVRRGAALSPSLRVAPFPLPRCR